MLTDTRISLDERRDLFIGKDHAAAVAFAVENWTHTARRAIQQRGRFAVALSGGSTPKEIYQALLSQPDIDWTKVWLFWSDERAVPPDHPESNYRMAMESFGKLPIPPSQIFRMHAEGEIEKQAREYEETIRRLLDKHLFDLVMLGLGEDGHIASLFPDTSALSETERLIVPNHILSKKCWRMTFTFPCIDQSRAVALYALGNAKQKIVSTVLEAALHSPWPASRIGHSERKALWVLDPPSAANLKF